ncbi:MAG: S41 family peptidase [Nitrospinaceae bacterium]|nr:MAG: S41 family peptidase [Nitrospinaceae bacterium]
MLNTRIHRLLVTGAVLITAFALFFHSPAGSLFKNTGLAYAGFFSQELETLEEVVDLVAEKYVYPPNYRKLFSAAIRQMMVRAGEKEFSMSDTPGGQKIVHGDAEVQYTLNFDMTDNWEAFRRVYYFLMKGKFGDYTGKDLETAAMIGVMNSLDLYSQYLDKSAFDKSMRDTEGQYGGLGMVVTLKDDKLQVVKTMKGAPAERAGILSGDVFLKVNGQSVKGMEITGLADKLRGYPNTQVTITLQRPGVYDSRDYSLTREIISVQTVEYERLDDHIGYIKITSFSKQSDDQLKDALRQAKKDGTGALVLDLRDNPGGLLNQSVKVASHFLYRGRLVVYTQGRAKEDYREYRAQLKNSLTEMPVVVLINQHSASASEIVAGALRDSGRAIIIGENSYGKGSVQTIFRISDGSGLRLTTSKYFTPSGIDITEHGIVPEIKIVKDASSIEGDPVAPSSKTGTPLGPKPLIQLVEGPLAKYLEKNGRMLDETHDSSLRFAQMVLRNATQPNNKNNTLEKAREIAANIAY